MQRKRDKLAAKEYDKAEKAHFNRQAESTQEMMKAAKKKQHRVNRIHRRSFFDRIFRQKCSKRFD